jgi:predicted nucleic acid-binding protein
LKAYYDEGDELHGDAQKFMHSVSSKEGSVRIFLASDYVLDETITLIRFARSHAKPADFALDPDFLYLCEMGVVGNAGDA